MKHHFAWLIGMFLMIFSFRISYAQDTIPETVLAKQKAGDFIDHTYKPLTLKLSDDGSKYIRFLFWNQMWARVTENNPGTLDVSGNPQATSTDIGIRRARVLAYAEISPRFLILSHWGINNQTFTNGGVPGGGLTGNPGGIPVAVDPTTGQGTAAGMSAKKPQLFFHDIWTEFKVVSELYVGMGLHYWNGISRMTSHSTLNFMAIDAPIFNWPLIELTDQFARQFGFYAKGQVGKWDYRLALNKPFSIGTGGRFDEANNRPVAANVINDNWATQGYIAYQFLEKENNKLPFFVGSYLGTKKVFNIGGGWHYHPEATNSRNGAGAIQNHDIKLFGLDTFLDLPLNKASGTALTTYAVFYQYDFGPNYMRNVGIMNVGFGAGTTQNGPGNAQPTIGTGSIFYTQSGFLLPKDILGDKGKLQPFGALTHKNFEFFNDSSWQYDLGMNYYINAHQAKVTLQYSQRPLFENFNRSGSAGEFILQTHIFL
ncbi:short chain amide porin [Belliella buryatensis]|uniref:Short chain amide porin n=2 Tax=Belliella buryatensis TaxID=1500549 RepID=A0A239BRB7_9BACT|nr:porin [Belliella buryatensis]SNS10615.1 short chain amide porin [Belliella buryatensis]